MLPSCYLSVFIYNQRINLLLPFLYLLRPEKRKRPEISTGYRNLCVEVSTNFFYIVTNIITVPSCGPSSLFYLLQLPYCLCCTVSLSSISSTAPKSPPAPFVQHTRTGTPSGFSHAVHKMRTSAVNEQEVCHLRLFLPPKVLWDCRLKAICLLSYLRFAKGSAFYFLIFKAL